MNRRSQLFVSVLAIFGALCFVSATPAQVKGKSRPLTTKQLMSGLIKPQFTAAGEAVKGSGPADDKAWDAAATSAALLNEAAHLMMDDGRCPDATWADAAKALNAASKTAIERIAAKDAAGAREALGAVGKACGACHAVHHKKK